MPLVRVCPCACLSQKYDSMAPKSNRQKQCKRIMEQQPRIMDARRRKAASSSEVCDECDLTDDRGARSLTACASVPVANASRTCFPTGQEPPVEVLQTLLAASDRAADARHPRDAKHGHELCGRFVAVPWAAWAGYESSTAVARGMVTRCDGRSHLSRTEHTALQNALTVI